ncbi:MAG: hypothetical protein ACE5KG_02065 [Nitrososphaerales archaeon]
MPPSTKGYLSGVFGLSTEGYLLASDLVEQGSRVNMVDENLQLAMSIDKKVSSQFASATSLMDSEALLPVEPVNVALRDADFIFFTPKIRKSGDEAKTELDSKLKDVANNLSNGSTFVFTLPTYFGGNSRIIDILERVSGLECSKDFNYIYAPLNPRTRKAIVIGSQVKKLEKGKEKILHGILGHEKFLGLATSEAILSKMLVSSYSNIVSGIESFKVLDNGTERDEMVDIYKTEEVYLNEMMDNMFDLRVITGGYSSGDPMLYLLSGIVRSVDGYIKFLADQVKNLLKTKELKASRTRIIIDWPVDEYEIRGEKLLIVSQLSERLRDFVSEVHILKTNTGSVATSRDRFSGVDKTEIVLRCVSASTPSEIGATSTRFTINANLSCRID